MSGSNLPPLLFLAHRIPYPPNKGDKIRSFHLLRGLSRSYRILLGAFVDDPGDLAYRNVLEGMCEELFLVPISPLRRRLLAVAGLGGGEAMSLTYYRDRRLRGWVEEMIDHYRPGHAFVFSSPMAQYLMGRAGIRRVMDMVDVDSEKWRAYAIRRRWPLSLLYRIEADRLLAFEQEVALDFDHTLFVSRKEAELFGSLAPDACQRVSWLSNGVDTDYFTPECSYPDPYPGGGPVLVFTGAMDYWANIDGVTWFARECLPRIRERIPDVRFCIVGSRPAESVQRLAALPGITVTGSVPDVRPYLYHAAAAVAPLRIARGLQNKVLEAMAMARPVLVTSAALEGISIRGYGPLTADCAQGLAARAVEILTAGDGGLGARGREFVIERHGWRQSMENLLSILDEAQPARDRRVVGQ